MVKIRATLLFYTPVDLSHPINYTRAGIEGRLRRSPGGNTVTFFSKSKLFGNSEQQMRALPRQSSGLAWRIWQGSKFRQTPPWVATG